MESPAVEVRLEIWGISSRAR